MGSFTLRRWSEFRLYILAFACLLFSLWASWRLALHPEVGASWSLLTGTVDQVSPDGPAFGRLQPGDRVLTVDGLPLREALLFPGKHPGDWVNFIIERDGKGQTIPVRLAQPSLLILLLRLEPIFTAVVFWSLGIVILAFRSPGKSGVLFFLFCQISSAALASGAVSAIGPFWNARLFGILLWWLGALIIHLHLHFPVPALPLYSRRLVVILYTLTAFGSLFDLAVDPLALHSNVPVLYAVRRLWLATSLFVVLLLLAWAYRRAISPETRYQVGLVTLGGAVALAPFLLFSVLPDALIRQPILPYEISFLSLLAIPLAYGYAIQHYRLIRVDRYINRSAASALVIAVLGGLYILLHAALLSLFPSGQQRQPVIDLVTMLLMAAAFGPLYHRFQIGVNRLFYGGWYDYRSAVQLVSHALAGVTDSSALAQTLTQGIRTAMQLECVYLLQPDGTGCLTAIGLICQSCRVHQRHLLHLDAEGSLGKHFQVNPAPVGTHALRSALNGAQLSAEEIQLLACEQSRLWIPLPGRDHFLGILVIGRKRGGDAFDAEDSGILEVVVRQASIALQNAQLIAELRQQALEGERLHHQVVRAREEERKRLARELHDQIIQALVGLNYRLSEIRRSPDVEAGSRVAGLQEDIRGILGDVRRICSDLRPPTLDSLGLIPAVRSRLRALAAQSTLEVEFAVEGNPEQNFPEEIALCLFRVLQEALINTYEHSAAQRVSVRLQIAPESVYLSVEDDGQGFVVPPRLGQLMETGHFGLMGVRERVELVNGTLDIVSTPGRGTRLVAKVPLAGKADP